LSRGERHLFVVPWRDYTLVGVWHSIHKDDPDRFAVTDDELEQFVAEVNAGYPGLGLSLDDISLWNAGLVPFGENPEGAVHLRYGHRSHLIDHKDSHGIDNLITLIGVRFTTGRYEAERAVTLAFRKLGRKAPRSRTASTPVFGGRIEDWHGQLQQVSQQHGDLLSKDVIRSVVHNYGSECDRVLREVRMAPDLGTCVGQTSTIKAQIRVAVRDEMAVSLSDVVFRRTDIATGEHPGAATLRECARVMGEEKHWSRETVESQIELVTRQIPCPNVRSVDTASSKRSAG
jgi:glycerol-3-phosphate dehydrogenase